MMVFWFLKILLGYEEALWSKKLAIGLASQTLTMIQILFFSYVVMKLLLTVRIG